MALTLMPDGKTFKKLNATQTKALNNYYKRLHDKPISETLGLPLGLVVLGGIGALAYIFKNEIKKAFAEQTEDLVTWVKDGVVKAGGGIVDNVILFTAGNENPKTPEFIVAGDRTIGPLSRCKRWETDANDWHRVAYDEGERTAVEMTLDAIEAKYIIKNMKKEGCERPLSFTVSQWED